MLSALTHYGTCHHPTLGIADALRRSAPVSKSERGVEYTYKVRRGRNRIYGGKVIENVCQAVARCIIGEQMLKIAKRYRVVLTVHDSVVCCVPEDRSRRSPTLYRRVYALVTRLG